MTEAVKHQFVKPAPIIWAHLITPRKARVVNGNEFKPQFEVSWLFEPDHPDFLALRGLLGQIATAEFGAQRVSVPLDQPGALKYPLENGTKLADAAAAKGKDREFLRGKILFKPHSVSVRRSGEKADPPRLKALVNGKYVGFEDDAERPAAAKLFYPGALCVGEVTLRPYTGMGGGVTAFLNEILTLNAGARINAGSQDDEAKYGAADKWSQYVGTVSSVDPTAGMTAGIPF